MTPDPTAGSAGDRSISRKTLLKAALVATAAPLLAGGGVALARDAGSAGVPLAPTPDCDDGDGPTHDQMEGPYFKPDSPLRTSLVTAGTPGVPLTVSGYVFGRACRPVPGVLLDFWQADTNGAYDMSGYAFRGHQFTDRSGAFTLTTVVAGLYPGRTRHIHVKARAPGSGILTTQLYFPGEPRNNTDTLYDPALLMNVRSVGSGKEGTFDFVLDVAQDPTDPTDPPTDPPTGPGGNWAVGTLYNAGDRVTYGGGTYRCLQAHTALTGWEPPNVPALWERG
ncbi:carbohydrate-binding protein [Streptomyces sp. NBC_01022]|uniref:carbohydrate-binding protein n=1 Tax=Streptomyces sp. NBC_01022 TaxID=2903723 RepID=UPI002DD8107B|nr:carbohydrate-binding protein [Streptomyces sp. NBC_01022]WRZ82579.1 dioxygenase [Streptomyces sp. NBC_01022]